MGVTNKELVEKAVIVADDLASGGKLNPQQSDKFVQYVIDETKLKGLVRTVAFRNEQAYIDKIGVGKRVAVPKAEATDPTTRRGVTTGRVTLTPKEIMVPFEVGDNFLEINIEGESVQDTIVRMMAAQLANNLEELYITGDVLGAAVIEEDILEGGSASQVVKDTYLALMDGWVRLADAGHVVDAENAAISSTLLNKLLLGLPTKFRKDRTKLKFLTSADVEQNYREKVAGRVSSLGDQALQAQINLTPFGVELAPIPLFPGQAPVVQHVVLSDETVVALRYKPIVADSVVVTASTLASSPTTPYIEDTDYDIDYELGTINRMDGGAIVSGATVKVTYLAKPQILLTNYQNLILGIGRDIRMEKDRNIFKGANMYAITVKAFCEMEEVDAVAKLINIGE